MAKAPKVRNTPNTPAASAPTPATPAAANKENTPMPTPTPAAKVDTKAAFRTSFTADMGRPGPDTAPDTIEAWMALHPTQRAAIQSEVITAAAKAGTIDRALAIIDACTLAATAGSKRAKAAKVVDVNLVRAQRIAALVVGIMSVPTPEGIDHPAVMGHLAALVSDAGAAAIIAAVSAVDTTKTPDEARIPVNQAADRAAAAVSRGGERATVTGRSLTNVTPGTVVTLTVKGTKHEATVDGERMLVGTAPFTSPTAAARSVNGDVSVNGWEAWKLADGRTLGAAATA